METFRYLGIAAAMLTTGAYIPQAIKTIKTKSTEDLSLVTFSMLFMGTVTWFFYGLCIEDVPLTVANGITASLSGTIFYLKLSSGKRKK